MNDIRGCTTLITGAAQGLGAALARELHSAGCRVICTDVNAEGAAWVADDLDGGAVSMALDVRDENQMAEVWERLEQEGGVDILINNAAVDHTLPVDELSIKQIDHVLSVNLRGPFLMCREALQRWKERGSGAIVNVCSTAAKRTWPNAASYHATKWGLLGLTHAINTEASPMGIRVTALVVGGMKTPFILERFPETDPALLQDPAHVAKIVRSVLELDNGSMVPEVMVLPVNETSWP